MEPLEYVRGVAEFLGVKIDLSKRPLIPRVETEYWVSETIKQISRVFDGRQKRDFLVLDMFAGSGCIGLAISRHVKKVKITFADKYKYFDHTNFIKSDVFEKVAGKYNYIFANPPYVATSKKLLVGPSVLKYEPKQALFAGKDGMVIIKKFLKQAQAHLLPSGKIFMEFSPEQKNKIEKLLKLYGYKTWKFNKDQFNRYRWVQID